MRKHHWLMIALLCAMLGGCGTKLFYNKLDWLLLFKLERYVDLHDAQEHHLKQVFSEFHSWHRTTQLPTYVAWLAALRARLAAPVDPSFWELITDDGQQLAERSRQQLLPAMIEMAASLSDAQVDQLLENIAEKRDEHADVVKMEPAKRVKEHRKDMRKQARRWLGRLSDGQEQAISTWAKSLEPFEEGLYAANQKWEQDLRAALAARSDGAALRAAVDTLTAVDADRLEPDLQALVDRNQLRTYRLLSDLVNNATPKQRAHLDKRLADYQQDFTELAQGASVPAGASSGMQMLAPTP